MLVAAHRKALQPPTAVARSSCLVLALLMLSGLVIALGSLTSLLA